MTRTTILLDSELLLRVKQQAQMQETTFTAIIREALSEYLTKQQTPPRFSFIAAGRTGKGNLSEDVEKILRHNARRRRK